MTSKQGKGIVKLKESRYRQLLRREDALVNGVKPLVDKLARITRQHKIKSNGTKRV